MRFKIMILLFFGPANIQSLFAAAEPSKELREIQEQYDQAINFLRSHDITVLPANLPELKNQNITLYENISKVINNLKEIIIMRSYDKFDNLLKSFIDDKTKKLKISSLLQYHLINFLIEPELFDEGLVRIFLKNGGEIDVLILETKKQFLECALMAETKEEEKKLIILDRNAYILKLIKKGSSSPSYSSH